MLDSQRIDKFLWTSRLFKTRNISTESCKKSQILVNDIIAKPSKLVKCGDKILLKQNPIIRSFDIIGLSENRLSAKLVSGIIRETTSQADLDKLFEYNIFQKQNKTTKPTKKERRELNILKTTI